jgi:hypothetical protein
MKSLVPAAVFMAIPMAALADVPGHHYVWTDVPYAEEIPAKIFGGETKCSTDYFGNVNCYTSPTYIRPASIHRYLLQVHVDCTDRTYDAKGDGRGWQSWREDAVVNRIASQKCGESFSREAFRWKGLLNGL